MSPEALSNLAKFRRPDGKFGEQPLPESEKAAFEAKMMFPWPKDEPLTVNRARIADIVHADDFLARDMGAFCVPVLGKTDEEKADNAKWEMQTLALALSRHYRREGMPPMEVKDGFLFVGDHKTGIKAVPIDMNPQPATKGAVLWDDVAATVKADHLDRVYREVVAQMEAESPYMPDTSRENLKSAIAEFRAHPVARQVDVQKLASVVTNELPSIKEGFARAKVEAILVEIEQFEMHGASTNGLGWELTRLLDDVIEHHR
ncbi:hypothetical protein [Aeromicrobium sp. 179-A 4D2 NHS]|uniref:hypothetical protein n=1 Tax=Aeromicrobium sp. 179-A 4D2 NHS TaxID=3142375 RepID=UPI0039A22180